MSISIATNFGSSASIAKCTFAGLRLRNRKSHTVRPVGQEAAGLDVHRDEVRRDDRRVDDRAHGQRVVDGRSAGPVHRLGGVVALDALADEPRRRLAGRRAQRAESVAVLARDQRPMGGVERDHPDRPAAVDDDPRRLGIQPDVELRRRRRVPVVVRPAHDHDLGDLLEDPGLLLDRGRDVRQRTHGHQRDVAVRREVGVDQPVDRVLVAGRDRRLGQVQLVAVDPRRRVDLFGLRAGQRPRHPAMDGDLRHPDPLDHPERVLHA